MKKRTTQIPIKRLLVLTLGILLLWGIVKLHTYTPVLLDRDVEILYENEILCGRYLRSDTGEVTGEYEVEFVATEILPEIVMQEDIYAELSYIDQNPNWINDQLNINLPGMEGHPSHKLLIAVLQGSVAHITEQYLWFGIFQQSKEFYQVYDFQITGYELYGAFAATTRYIVNRSMTQTLVYTNHWDLKAAIESGRVEELIQ